MSTWSLQDAKARFSELVHQSITFGPQIVTRRGQDAVVVISATQYGKATKNSSLGEFFHQAPRANLSIDRNTDPPRSIEL